MAKVKKIPQKYIDKIIEYNPFALLTTSEYINEHTDLEIYCTKHNINYHHSLKNAMRHNGCPGCKQDKIDKKTFSQEEFERKVYLKNPHIKMLGKYAGQGSRILCECLIHHVKFTPISQTLLDGCGGCSLCKKESCAKFRISSDNIKKNFHGLNPTLSIVDEEARLNTFVNVHCDICGCDFPKKITSPYISDKPCSCNVCTNRYIVKGFNDISTLRPDLIKYLKNKEDAYKYGPGFTAILLMACPDCGYEKYMRIEVLARQGFACPCCGDGISYPNKFVRSFIRQLNVDDIDFEYSPKWAKGYFYDCYFNYQGMKYVVEVDGVQHFKKTSNFKMSLEKIQERDKEKDKLAQENQHVLIRIDAQKSKKNYLVESINNSLFVTMFDLTQIDWDKCDDIAMLNLAKEICFYAEKNMPNNYEDLCNTFNIGVDTIRTYLKQGIQYGWCDDRVLDRLSAKKRVNVYDRNNNLIYMFSSITECCECMSNICKEKYSINGIRRNLHGEIDHYKDYIFKFAYT